MKKILLCVLILFVVAGIAWAQEEEKERDKPLGSVSFILIDSYAPIGVGLEFFLGQFGLGPTFTTLFFVAEGNTTFLLEPGAYVRYYFGDLSSTFFVSVGRATSSRTTS